MGADKRCTMGNMISDKEGKKVHEITETMYACGAGCAADLAQVTNSLFCVHLNVYVVLVKQALYLWHLNSVASVSPPTPPLVTRQVFGQEKRQSI